jgi:cytochrome P450
VLNPVFREAARLPPRPVRGPPPTPLLGFRGNLLQLMRDPLEYLLHVWRRYGNFAAVTAGDPSFVCAFGAEHNRTLLSNDELFEQYFTVLPAPEGSALERLTRNALVANGEEHRRQRRVTAPPFQRRSVNTHREEMVAVVERALQRWRIGDRIELASELRAVTLGTILRVVFGIEAGAEPELFERSAALLGRFLAQLGSELAILFPLDMPGSAYRRLLQLSSEVETLVLELQERAALDRQSIPARLAEKNRELGSRDPAADLVGQLVTLLLAGQETTNNALAWSLLLLSQHPPVLRSLEEELRPLRGNAPSLDELERLPLLDHVVKESLRLLPPAANGARRATAPVKLGETELPQGSVVIFSAFISHRFPEVYSDPQCFRPSRWEQLEPSAFEYIPFGVGARSCVGNHFALLEMKLALAIIVQRFTLRILPQRIDFALKPALAPRRGITAQLLPAGTRIEPARIEGQVARTIAL